MNRTAIWENLVRGRDYEMIRRMLGFSTRLVRRLANAFPIRGRL
jgi:hypothetical protein